MLTKAKVALKALKKLKGIMNKANSATGGNGKKFLFGFLAFLLIMPIIILNAQVKTILCATKIFCEYKAVNDELVEDAAGYLEKVRNKAWDKLENSGSNEKFKDASEVSQTYINNLPEDEQEDYNPRTQAEMLLRVFLALDQTVYLQTGSQDLKKGGSLNDTIIKKSMSISKKNFEGKFMRVFEFKSFSDKKYKTNKERYLLDYRISVYMCYLTGDNCNDDTEAVLFDEYNIAVNNNGKDFDNAQIKQLFEKFYDISFFKAAEGKISFVPEGKGKELFDEYLDQYLEDYNNMYPSTIPGSMMTSFGWLVPLEEGTYRRSSGFGGRSCGNVQGCHTNHKGTDLSAAEKTPIYAARAGVVKKLGYYSTAGWTIAIDHLDGYYTLYLHMKPEYRLVKEGQMVAQGQMIGGVGNEGASSGAHLHFEICTNLNAGGFCVDGYNIDPESEGFFKDRFTSSRVASKSSAAVKLFEAEKANPSPADKPAMMPGYVPGGGIGAISTKYEANMKTTCETASDGYIACGPWQIHGETFQFDFRKFLKEKYPNYYAQFPEGAWSSRFTAAAKTAYVNLLNKEGENWINAQRQFMYESHYLGLLKDIKKHTGVDFSARSAAVQEMLFSASVFERFNFIRIGMRPAMAVGVDFNKLSDVELIHYVYQMRIKIHNYLSPRYNWENRFIAEYLDVMSLYTTGSFNPQKSSVYYKKGTAFPKLNVATIKSITK